MGGVREISRDALQQQVERDRARAKARRDKMIPFLKSYRAKMAKEMGILPSTLPEPEVTDEELRQLFSF